MTTQRKVVNNMEFKLNVTTDTRKAMVAAIGEILATKPIYQGPPSFAFTIGDFTVRRDGTIFCADKLPESLIDKVVDGLIDRGFGSEPPELFTIELPKDLYSEQAIENLKRLIAGKANLIRQAMGATNLDIVVSDDKIAFPWFRRIPSPDEIKAYTFFISATAAMAKTLKHARATEREVDNEKYAFRCFLLRLGFIGDEYKEIRRQLIKNLSGNSAFRSGEKGGEEETEHDHTT